MLLAEVEVSLVEALDGALVVADNGWQVNESDRPYLLHTRLLQELLLTGAPVVTFDSPPSGSGGPAGPPINAITAQQVTGPPTASWHPASRTLELGIPAGAGIDSVVVAPLPPGTPPAVISFAGGVLTLGIANGPNGSPGPGIVAVNAVGLPFDDPPTATLAGQVLTLGLPAGPQGIPGPPGKVPAGPTVVAAGSFGPQGAVNWSFHKLRADPIPGFSTLYFLSFDTFDASHPYAVTGMAITAITDPGHTIEVLRFKATSDPEQAILDKVVESLKGMGRSPEDGIVIRAFGTEKDSQTRGFTLEISDYFKLTDQ